MQRPRDGQRKALYTWERSLPGWPGAPLSLRECQALVEMVWRERTTGAPPLVRDGRGRRHACYAPAPHDIRLPRWSRRSMIVLHEVAHALLGARIELAWHGPEFAALYLELLGRHLELDTASARRLGAGQRPRRVHFA